MPSTIIADPPQHATRAGARTQLGFAAGGIRWLVDSVQGVQVIDTPITPVPLARPWYLGLVRHQQKLLGAVDLAGLCGGDVLPVKALERMLILPEPWQVALRVERVHGLIDAQSLPAAHDSDPVPSMAVPPAPGLVRDSEQRVDGAGTRWHVLDLARLCTSAVFLQAGISLPA